MAYTLYDRTIAFAGMCQAASLVYEIAQTGKSDSLSLTTNLKSIISVDPSSTLDVFGHESNLKLGLNTFIQGLNGTPKGNELTKYVLSLIMLEKKLSADQSALKSLSNRIDIIKHQTNHYELTTPEMINNIASIYLDVITPLGPRIQVSGSPEILKIPQNQDKVRAVLLSGIRCAVLWRQVGGRKTQLLFSRKKMVEQAKILLARVS